MARIHRVSKSAKEHICSFNGHTIPKGEPYTWAKPGFRTRRALNRCAEHPFRESDLIQGQRQVIVRAKEDAVDAISSAGSVEEVESAMQDFAAEAEDYLNTRQEALDAWENGNSQLEEFVYQAEAILDEVNSWDADEFEEPDAADVDLDAELYETFEEYVEDRREEHLNEVRESASDLLDGLEM
jgi:hypothetical protein